MFCYYLFNSYFLQPCDVCGDNSDGDFRDNGDNNDCNGSYNNHGNK